MKAVFDTNVLIAAFATEGICSKLLMRGRKRQFDLAICPFILKEFERIIVKKLRASKQEIEEALSLISEATCLTVNPKQDVSGICRDTDDNNILACAVEAKADYIVTGDADLLELKKFRGIPIVTPREFESLFDD